ncbi:hypothetical protein C0J52_05554 [Blattella germanica]|nr:hypothetical protein C0J52_05554 [Blattella germanica]
MKRRKVQALRKVPDNRQLKIKNMDKVDRNLTHCFVCDGLVSGKGTSLLKGCAPYSKNSLTKKIGELMGERFMIIVSVDDVLCRRCSSLIIRLDKLEVDVQVVKNALTGYLKMKYNLYEDDTVSANEYSREALEENALDELGCDDQYIFQAMKGVDLEYSDEDNVTPSIKQEFMETEESENVSDSEVTGYKCVSCQFKTSVSEEFLEHLKIHSSEMYFKCSNCDTEFQSHWEIQEHITSVHKSQAIEFEGSIVEGNVPDQFPLTVYECSVCKFQCPDKSVFDRHVCQHERTSHYKCSICFEALSSKELLKEHMDNHKLFQCGLCNATFKERNDLLEHFEEHNISQDFQVKPEQTEEATNENRKEYVESTHHEAEEDNSVPSADKEIDYGAVEAVLERIHSENPIPVKSSMSEIGESENISEQDVQEGVVKDESINKEQCSDEQVMLEKEYGEVSGNFQETIFQLDNAIFSKDDDHLSTDMDKNEGSETNDILNDPTQFLEEFQMSTENPETQSLNDENQLTTAENNENVDNCSSENKKDDSNNVASLAKRRVYVCSICGLRAYSENQMKRHFKSHIALEKKIFECHICNKVLTTRSNLNRHLSNHENCPGAVTCKLCNEELIDRLHLKQHLEDQHTGPLHCSFCDMEFTNKRAFKEHELTHPERAIHQCDICHKRFLTHLRLRTHLENIHNDSKDGDTEDKIYKCHICSKILTTYHNLKRHVRNHEKSSGSAKCTLCSEELTDKLHLRQHVEEVHPETHQCSFCQKVFSNKKVCKTHELTHPERYVYKCDICEKMFLNETRLEKHKTMFHRDPHCRYCEKEIEDPMKLFNHERRHEMYKNKFPCELCTKVFRTPSGLRYHMSTHTGKYAVYCEICGKGMHSEIVLEEHKATHTKEIRYTCELCGRNFTSNSTYRMHRKWHDDPLPYKCKICDRKFKHTSILAVHMRRAHTGERPYKCPHCPYTFSVSSTLQKHIILHTKKYPYNCKLCGKGFTTRSKLAKHMARVHNDYEMVNAKPTPCEYKMALKPSEISSNPEESSVKEDLEQPQLSDVKFEEAVVEEQIVDAGQAIFLFQ